MIEASATQGERPTLSSFSPASGRTLGEIQGNTPAEVREAVSRARQAQPAWAALGARGRARALAEVRYRIHEGMDDIVRTVSTENGKPLTEAITHDVLPAVLTLAYMERATARALRPQPTGRLIGPLFGMSSRIEWRPFGVVGCITPWNYPFYLSFMAIVPALMAGNAVVVKPSEYTPGVGERMREVLEPLPKDVCTVVQGAGEVGAALVDAPCDKICFIGSPATGRRIAEAAAKHLTPVVMELGGQDATIVCEDADLDVASSGVLWGAFLNAGQTCCAIERAYVVEAVADRFEELLTGKLARLRTAPGMDRGAGPEGDGKDLDRADAAFDIGPLTVSRQHEVVERHVRDAVERGGRVLAGGAPGRGEGLWFQPTVIEGRSEDMAIFREESFGPLLPIVRVRDEEEAVRRANGDGFNLTASVWTRDRARGDRIAGRLRAGTVSVNDHGSSAGAPWGVWGGVGESGYGRLQGILGLREFATPVHVARAMMPMKRPWWYPYDRATTTVLRSLAEIVSAPTLTEKARAVPPLVRSVRQAFANKV